MSNESSTPRPPSKGVSAFLARWAILGIAVMVSGLIVPGVSYDGLFPLVVAALVLGILNAFVKPVLVFLTLPVTVLTLGVFLLVINAGLLSLVASLVRGFQVDGFGSAVLGSILISLVASAVQVLTGVERE